MSQPTRNTWQREAVRRQLVAASGFVSAKQLHLELSEHGHALGLATVYRTLSWLSESGEVDSLQSPDGENLFRACDTAGHHHHLICMKCGVTHEVEAKEIETWAGKVGVEHGFTEIRHVVDLFGTCQNCQL